ncbi:transcriptional regulatory protein TdiR [mine drainage metagenome]|uniref:Transcriptional regulatory protein TdiR n=1 Tax=mine drainage metagenome TaxID=410659 RepID=A0A1J5QFN3_9ZZZZ
MKTTAPILIYIIDDEPAVRDSLTLLLEQNDFVVEAFDSAESFLAACSVDMCGCAIVDVNMAGINGLQLQEEMLKRGLRLPIVFLTGNGNIPMSVRAIKVGAVDFLTKPVTRERLLDSIRAAIQAGERVQAQVLKQQKARSLLADLTEREREVMSLAVQGYPNKEIARRLDISHRTVEIHKARIMHKTGATNLLDLATGGHRRPCGR